MFCGDIDAEILELIYVYGEAEQIIKKALPMLEVPDYLYKKRKRQSGMEEGKGEPCGVGLKL